MAKKASMQRERYRLSVVWSDFNGNVEVEFHNNGINYFEDREIATNAVRIGASGRLKARSSSLLTGNMFYSLSA
ncbi:MAG: hypothetical protein O9256_00700 [Rhizobiaceae bacterium]|nr:hypothetical protein [Rhizobiaceae bacterium]